MKEYNLVYAKSFADSLSKLINTWENELFLSPETINKFVGNIQKSLELATVFPEMYEEVSSKYGFSVKTYRIVIGKSYAIFYRIDEKNNNISKPVEIGGFKKNSKRTYIHIDQNTEVIKSCVLLTSSFYFQFNFGGKYYGNI